MYIPMYTLKYVHILFCEQYKHNYLHMYMYMLICKNGQPIIIQNENSNIKLYSYFNSCTYVGKMVHTAQRLSDRVPIISKL
jgi:hypothetical protein